MGRMEGLGSLNASLNHHLEVMTAAQDYLLKYFYTVGFFFLL